MPLDYGATGPGSVLAATGRSSPPSSSKSTDGPHLACAGRCIHQRCADDPETLENRTLMRITRAIHERRKDFDDADIWALGQEALGLLDAVIERTINQR